MATKTSTPTKASTQKLAYTVPGLTEQDAKVVVGLLQERLDSLNDLALTLKHIHWNVVGPHFIAVHKMLDPQVDSVRLMVDALAERMAALGGAPVGTPGALVQNRNWEDYKIGRADAIDHLRALDRVYSRVVEGHRNAIEATDEPDPVTQDMFIQQTELLEQYQWFVRAHFESSTGTLNGRR
jgi:starvation-inducible DNA-binding protein